MTAPAGFRRFEGDVTGVVGGEGPPLVLLHGWPQTSRAWLPVAPALAAAGYTVVAPDLPGLGGSAPPRAGFAKVDVADTVREAVRELVGTEPLRLVGHDIGGMVALAWAHTRPDEIARLAVVDTGLPGLGLEEAMNVARGGRWHHGFFMTPDVPAMLIDGTENEFFTWWFGRLAGRPGAFSSVEIEHVVAAYRGRETLDRSFGYYRALLDDGRATAAWLEGGGRLAMPVAAIGGGNALGESVAKNLAPAARDLYTIVIDGAGHFVAEEQPASFVEHLLPFLA